MSEELKKYVEDALYNWIKKQIEAGNFKANLKILIDSPIEVRGMKGKIIGEIVLSEQVPDRMPIVPLGYTAGSEAPAQDQGSGAQKKEAQGGSSDEMSLAEVDKLLRSLGV
jgi:hypothetical protein